MTGRPADGTGAPGQAARGAIVLASASPRRAQLLASAGVRFETAPSHVPEAFLPDETPVDHVRRLAEAKARAVAGRHPGRFFVGADTIVVCDGEPMGKPRDRQDAERMLGRLSGRWHEVVTAYAVYDAVRDRMEIAAVTTRVRFRPLEPREIAAYADTGCPLDKAGAYGIQGRAAAMVERIEGSYTNVVGLPLEETLAALARMGALP